MNILEEILAHKRNQVARCKELYPVKLLEQSLYFETRPLSMKHYITRPDLSGIIAEFKRKSPSKGIINAYASVEKVSIGYMQAGASALSILTDSHFFGGSSEDLKTARNFNFCPILRKDFILDPYQIIEAKSIGADTILLIAAALSPEKTAELARFAQELGLEVLLEIHNEQELSHLNPAVDLVGVNNRNLNDFSVKIQTSLKLAEKIPADFIKISESGISSPDAIKELKEAGFQGFLIGERFMKTDRPCQSCAEFIKKMA